MDTTQSLQTPQNPEGHSQAASPAGQGQSASSKFGIGAFNAIGVDHSRVSVDAGAKQASGTEAASQQATSPQGQSSEAGKEGTNATARQLTEKDERHFATFVTKATQEKYDLAKIAIETDEKAIFKIAQTDKDLAQRLLKEFDYGTENVDELLDQQRVSIAKNPEQAQKEIEDSRWKENMEKQLMEEKILRLKGEDPDLNGDVEEKFREIFNDKAFSKYDDQQKVAIAKTLHGKAPKQTSADNVALAVLKREEGIASSPKGAAAGEKGKVISPEMRKMMQSANMTEKDLAVLPPNIDELIQSMYGPLVG